MSDFTYTIRPILGLKSNVPQNDPSLLVPVGDFDFATYAVDGVNFDVLKRRGSASKSLGQTAWSSRQFNADFFTEVDVAGNKLDFDNMDIVWTGLDNDEACYGYYDAGASAINGDFEFRTSFSVSSISAAQELYLWAVGDTVGTINNNTDYLYFKLTESGGNLVPSVGYNQDASADSANGGSNLNTGTTYFLIVTRDESVGTYGRLTMTVYSGSFTGTQVSTAYVDLNAKKDYRYWFVIQNDDSGLGGVASIGSLDDFTMISGFNIDKKCHGLFEQDDGTNLKVYNFNDGKVYRYDSGQDTIRVGSETFGTDDILFSAINFGLEMVFTRGTTGYTPYCSDFNDTILAKAISSGTEYKIKYLESFHLRIIGAYIDTAQITNGDISIIWSEQLPVPGTSCTFGSGDPPTNHLFRGNDDPITGIKRMGNNACYLYGQKSIDSIDYYPNYQNPFAIRNVVGNEGAANHHSIVDIGGRHLLFNRNYGFCEYRGGIEFPYGGRPLSEEIENKIATISYDEIDHIQGTHNPVRNEVVWCVPLDGATSPSHLLYFNYLERMWRIKDIATRSVIMLDSDYPNDASTKLTMLFSDDDFITLKESGDDNDGSDFDGYRVEPILQFGQINERSMINEIWFGITNTGNYSIDVYHRSGDTVGEVEAASWTALDSVSCNSVDNPVTHVGSNVQRFHQIKWGCDAKNEPFQVNTITFMGSLGKIY